MSNNIGVLLAFAIVIHAVAMAMTQTQQEYSSIGVGSGALARTNKSSGEVCFFVLTKELGCVK